MILRALNAFLKVLDNIALKVIASSNLSAQDSMDVTATGEGEFRKQVAEHEIAWQESRPNQEM